MNGCLISGGAFLGRKTSTQQKGLSNMSEAQSNQKPATFIFNIEGDNATVNVDTGFFDAIMNEQQNETEEQQVIQVTPTGSTGRPPR